MTQRTWPRGMAPYIQVAGQEGPLLTSLRAGPMSSSGAQSTYLCLSLSLTRVSRHRCNTIKDNNETYVLA